MMNFQKKKFISSLSQWSIALLVFFFFSLAFYNELFHQSRQDFTLGAIYTHGLNREFFQGLQELILRNRIGEISIQKDSGEWKMSAPYNLPLKEGKIEELFEDLIQMKITKVHQWEPINLTSYLLDSPPTTVTFNQQDEAPTILALGLTNPVDNGQFLTLSGQKVIYQVNSLKQNWEGLTPGELVEDRLFPWPLGEIMEFSIYRGRPSSYPSFQITQSAPGVWIDRNKTVLTPKKVEEFYARLMTFPSRLLLETLSPEVQESFKRELGNPRYTLVIKDGVSESQLVFSQALEAMEELKIKRREQVLVHSPSTNLYFLLPVERAEEFALSSYSLR